MVQFDKDESTQCAVYDFTPGSEQKKINIIIRPGYTVSKVFSDIATQYHYDRFDLILQPIAKTNELVYLNDCKDALIYKVNGFQPSMRNVLVLLPTGEWDGNVKKRYQLSISTLKSADSKIGAKKQTTNSTTAATAAATATATNAQQQETNATTPTKTTTTKTTATKATKLNENDKTAATTKTKSDGAKIVKTKKIIKVKKAANTANIEAAAAAAAAPATDPVPKDGVDVVGNDVVGHTNTTTTTTNGTNSNSSTNPYTFINSSSSGNDETAATITITTTTSIINTPTTMTATTALMPMHDDLLPIDASTTPPPPPMSSGPGSTNDSLNLSPCSEPEPLSDDDLALGASASPTETEPMNGDALSLAHTSPNGSRSKFSALSEEAFYQHISTLVQSPASAGAAATTTTTTTTASATPSAAVSEDDNDMRPSSEKCRRTARSKAPLSLPTNGDATVSAGVSGVNNEPASGSSSCTSNTTTSIGYRGLVNQAMTCYLNSLLQALYMTPEFRNALYRWEFDNDSESKNIPYQLQKLFLNLQTSKKSAVETTYLTRSFGWDSTEAWQQHDIQELCRVMFDALEHKFRNTKQANLISTLYEGKMIDYVKCLECQTEKARIDTFLDIPLPVRPFGSTVAYGSIEEALRAFVQPETLNGNNQYFCEKCNKKCDAHKGLKFKTFPYILTLHLKRFDFDYQTMHRIKLNDKVTYPQTLNLNTFVSSANDAMLQNGCATQMNGDDCSTTDSGSAMEEDNCSSGVVTTASSSQHENDMNDDDEGIDMSTSTSTGTGTTTDHRITNASASASECTDPSCKRNEITGPYSYELFAIMIHSGSASGGHYYAYIKEFDNNEWYCFNDQSVTTITEEDIHKSFGGSATKGYYTSAYTSSTNAYMLMYRQIDGKRNERAMQVNDFPPHINALLPNLNAEDEAISTRSSRLNRYGGGFSTDLPLHTEQIKPRVYFYNPELKKLKVTRVYVSRNFDINSVLESAYPILNVDKFAPITRCRLVEFDATSEEIIQSFENNAERSENAGTTTADYLLEYRAEEQEFEIYKRGGATWYVYVISPQTMEMDGPYLVHSAAHENNNVLRHSISVRLHVDETRMLLATLSNNKAFIAYDANPTEEAEQRLQTMAKTRFRSLTYFYMYVPKTDACYLEIMGIPAYEEPKAIVAAGGGGGDVVDAVLMNGRESPTSSLAPKTNAHESNSEDSSLSDGDRTLVESLPQQHSSCSSSSTNSPQLSSPDDEAAATTTANDSYKRIAAYLNEGSSTTNDSRLKSLTTTTTQTSSQYFHAIELKSCDNVFDMFTSTPHQPHHQHNITTSGNLTSSSSATLDDDSALRQHAYKIICDSHMKMEKFQQHIESLIRVPANYFKIQRKHGSSTDLISSEQLLVHFSEGESLLIELGKALQPDEQKAKIFFMRLADLDNQTARLPCICEWIYKTSSINLTDAKIDLIAKLQRIDAVKYQTLNIDNCRLWSKSGRTPMKILREDDSFPNSDFLVQECEAGINPQPPEDSMTLFVRQWHADILQLDQFQEITLDADSEIKQALSKLSGLPEEHIAYCKINSAFPCTSISLLSVNSSMSWFSIAATRENYPLSTSVNGNVYFYKDVRKAPKELSIEERRDWNVKEKNRLDQLGGNGAGGISSTSSSLYSPRRERALKIYVDSTPSTAAPMETTNDGANATTATSLH